MAPLRTALLLVAAHACRASVDVQCTIFDETMICDNERSRVHRAEIRTCSG